MTVKINTKDGQIELTDEVIATVVGGATTEIFGVVGMASKNALKDNFQALLGKENYSKGVVIKAAEDGSIAGAFPGGRGVERHRLGQGSF